MFSGRPAIIWIHMVLLVLLQKPRNNIQRHWILQVLQAFSVYHSSVSRFSFLSSLNFLLPECFLSLSNSKVFLRNLLFQRTTQHFSITSLHLSIVILSWYSNSISWKLGVSMNNTTSASHLFYVYFHLLLSKTQSILESFIHCGFVQQHFLETYNISITEYSRSSSFLRVPFSFTPDSECLYSLSFLKLLLPGCFLS